MEEKKKLIVIDGNSLLFRAYYATSFAGPESIMRNSKGEPTNAIFAFSNMLLKILSSFNGGESIFVAFDADSHTFRKEEFEDYKANRAPCPEELIPQFPMSRELLDCLGITHYEEHGIEADDIAGTIAKIAADRGYEVNVYTSDKDYLQLVDSNITVTLLKKGLSVVEEITPTSMVELFGFTPRQIIDYKGLRGDSSDNLPGIPGIGDKTAVKLIQEYGDFDSIIIAAKEGRIKGKLGEHIVEGEEMGRKCLHLAEILIDAPLPIKVEELGYQGYDFARLSAFASRYELKQLINRIPARLRKEDKDSLVVPEVEIISSFRDIEVGDSIGVSLDIDSSSYHDEDPFGIAIACKDKIYYEDFVSFKEDSYLKAILENENIKKKAFDCKKILLSLDNYDIKMKGVDFDMLLACYLLDSSASDNAKLCFAMFGVDISKVEEKVSLFDLGESEENGKIAFYSLRLEEEAKKRLREDGSFDLYQNIEFPLAFVLAKMEKEGFPLDDRRLTQIGEDFYRKKDEWEKKCHEYAGCYFNVGSPKQVSDILFDKLHLGGNKKKGTSVEVLKELVDEHPVVNAILNYRKYAKLCSTYIDGLRPHIKADGKIHSVFHQAQTTTGRLSSSNPNLQNISTRDEESKLIRKAFHYKDDLYIMSLDYAQIELRLLSHLANCQSYIDVFNSGHDLHCETARKVFKIKEGEEVPHELRRKAKAVNFAIIYGTSAYGLSEQIDSSPKYAADVISSFYEAYPEIRQYLDEEVEKATRLGYATTLFGRRRHLRDLSDPSFIRREAARRAAMNAPVQGSAADLLKIAMIEVDKFLSSSSYKCKMVLTIHDELLFALPEEEIDILYPKIKEIMETAVKLKVRLLAEGSAGETWYDAKD
ncbi:MAG: DNA polymerase I [Bacilli bacterium]|nr:DNA polymerase I [Bacilli bacterium]